MITGETPHDPADGAQAHAEKNALSSAGGDACAGQRTSQNARNETRMRRSARRFRQFVGNEFHKREHSEDYDRRRRPNES